MTRVVGRLLLISCLCLSIVGCSEEELPSRDEIPIIKERLYALEQALRSGETSAVDSLLSVSILDLGLSSDSLMRVVYGPDNAFSFAQLGDYEIFYSHDLAVIDCFIMDSSRTKDHPIKLHYKNVDGLWLVTEFVAGEPAEEI